MKISFLFIFTMVYVSTFSQTVKSIDELIYRVDHTKFTDSITIFDTTKSLTNPFQITAFLSGDKMMKTVARFKDLSRIRITYYRYENYWSCKPLYVKEFDSISNELLTEVYGFDYTVLKSDIKKPLNDEELKQPNRLLKNGDYSIKVGFALVDRKAEKYHFKVRLIHASPLPADCGYMAFAVLQKFEVITTDFPKYDNKFVLIIEPCPEFLGDKFFQDNKIYEVDVATNSGVTFGYSYYNNYEKEKLPIFWSRKIVKED